MARWLALLAVCLVAGCHAASAQGGADSCAPPPAWQAPGARPGQPAAEFAACLKDKAYAARNLNVPLEAAANGIIAQCSVEVDRFEGAMVSPGESGSDEKIQAEEQDDMQRASAAVTQYRHCVGR